MSEPSELGEVVQEGSAKVFLPKNVFYNPVQEFNRDLTISVISTYWNMLNSANSDVPESSETAELKQVKPGVSHEAGLTVLEALAATGMRSCRFALEIPGLKCIVANDYDKGAVEIMKKNIENNDVGHIIRAECADAAELMYTSQKKYGHFDVIDLDPYGSPCQFLDAAVQAVKPGGLLCVTCTDMGVLCGSSSEKCWAAYGSMPLKSRSCHEMALRIVLSTIDRAANKYRRFIEPLLSVSVDFYIRLFVRVREGAIHVKDSASKQATVYQCTGCGAKALQPMARIDYSESTRRKSLKKSSTKTAEPVKKYSYARGPPVGPNCDHCGNTHHIGGPIWADPIHCSEFVPTLLEYICENKTLWKTSERMEGVLSVITEELPDVPLYDTMSGLCGVLHCVTPTFVTFRSALLNLGYRVSLSHAAKNSIKTDAPPQVVWDILRCWVKENPVHKRHMVPGTPCYGLLTKEPVTPDISFKEHDMANPVSRQAGVLRYMGHKKNWGPKAKPGNSQKGSLPMESQSDKSKRLQNKKRRGGSESDQKHFTCKRLKFTGSCPHGETCKYSHDLAGTTDAE